MTSTLCSTLKPALLLLFIAAGGCAAKVDTSVLLYYRPKPAQFDAVLPDPAPDEAATLRSWDVSTFNYPNGAVAAGRTYNLNYEDRPCQLENDYVYAAAQPGIVMLDALAMPVWVFLDPGWTAFQYHGARYRPSMTVAPPFPAE